MNTADAKQKAAVITELLKAIGECLKGQPNGVPAGVLYSQLMAFGCNLEQYNNIETAFINAGKVRKQGNLLYWIN